MPTSEKGQIMENIFRQLCSGLMHMHMKHMIAHHDIKPKNIMVKFASQDGPIEDRLKHATFVYIDFGLARQYETKLGTKETIFKTGGTPFIIVGKSQHYSNHLTPLSMEIVTP